MNALVNLTALLLMYQCRVAEGFDLSEVQLTLTWSPTWYVCFPPEMRGPPFGNTAR